MKVAVEDSKARPVRGLAGLAGRALSEQSPKAGGRHTHTVLARLTGPCRGFCLKFTGLLAGW